MAQQKTIPTKISIDGSVVDAAETSAPASRTFRNAWVLNGPVIEVDMDKAREIFRNKLRQDRKPLLDKLDADYMKALESADTDLQATIATQKQALRDVTSHPSIEGAATPEELESMSLASLT